MLGVIATAVRREEFLSFLSRRGLGAGGRNFFGKKLTLFFLLPLSFSRFSEKKNPEGRRHRPRVHLRGRRGLRSVPYDSRRERFELFLRGRRFDAGGPRRRR